MSAIASQITSLTIVYSIVYSDTDQRKHQSCASLAFVCGIHRGPVNSPHKWPVTRKMFPFDDVIMLPFKVESWRKWHMLWRGNFTSIPQHFNIAKRVPCWLIMNSKYQWWHRIASFVDDIWNMMTSPNGSFFCVTSPLCGEFTGHRWIPLTKGQWRGCLNKQSNDQNVRIVNWWQNDDKQQRKSLTSVIYIYIYDLML